MLVRRPTTVALLALAAVSACGSFGAADERVPTPSNEAGTEDAGTDGSSFTSDGAVRRDGGRGCGWDAIEEPFESAETPLGWSLQGTSTAITLTADTVIWFGGSRSLRIDNPGVTGSRYYERALTHAASTPGCIHSRLSVRRGDSWPSISGGANIFGLVAPESAVSLSIGINREGELELAELNLDGDPYNTLGVAAFAAGKWVTVDLRVDITTGGISWDVDGTPMTLRRSPELIVGKTPSKVYAGAVYVGDQAKNIWIDELSVE